jgi:hypothetical protein
MFFIARKLGVKLPRDFKYLSMDLREKEIYISRKVPENSKVGSKGKQKDL